MPIHHPSRRRALATLAAPAIASLPFALRAQPASPFTPADLAHAAALRDGALRGRPGPVYARLHEAYQRAIQSQSV